MNNKTLVIALGAGLSMSLHGSLAEAFQTAELTQGYQNTGLVSDTTTASEDEQNQLEQSKIEEGKCAAGKCAAGQCGS